MGAGRGRTGGWGEGEEMGLEGWGAGQRRGVIVVKIVVDEVGWWGDK